MCGIVGLIDHRYETIPRSLLRAMRDVMFLRGPDGVGEFVDGCIGMAMRRLAVIDLDHGGQPLTSRSDQIICFQNGEIYNYKSLRRELQLEGYMFRTSSDTEVLAHGYACWGIDGLLSRIDGMYAFAIFDREKRLLYLARDRFGEKPLFYCSSEGRFAYASDLRCVASLPWVSGDVDPTALNYYLGLHYVPGERTILRDVKRVLPGEYLRVCLDNPVPEKVRYYSAPIGSGVSVLDDEIAAAIEYAVTSRLVADVPVGVFLSGGLDSSIVAAIAAKANPFINTFSIGFRTREHDESPYARSVAQHIGSNHHHFIFDEKEFTDLLPHVAGALDEPVGDQALLPVYWLSREARKHVKVVLSGEGADEVFAGYSYYAPFAGEERARQRIRAWLGLRSTVDCQPGLLMPVRRDLDTTPSGFPLLTNSGERQQLLGTTFKYDGDWEQAFSKWLGEASNPLQRATCVDLVTWLPDDLLVKFDRMAMANSLEGRAPYLDPRVVEMGISGLSIKDKIQNGISKVALRRIGQRWLPNSILSRKKQGFVLPMRAWIKQWFDAYGGPVHYFSIRPLPMADSEQMNQLISRDLKHGIRRERMLFALIVLVEWYAKFRESVGVLRAQYKISGNG